MSKKAETVVAFMIVAMSAYACQSSEASNGQIATATAFAIPLTWTSSPAQHPTIKPTSSPIPTSIIRRGWFLITNLESTKSVSLETAQSFIGTKIPPLPDNITEEFVYLYPDGGELPSSTTYHQIFVMRQGNARMIWLGIPLAETTSWDESHIYDAIPMPSTQAGDVLIAFTCSRNNESDDSLVVIASRPNGDEPATDIHYAWQIDSKSTTLRPVNYQDIECWSY